jgi:hypothetical protein
MRFIINLQSCCGVEILMLEGLTISKHCLRNSINDKNKVYFFPDAVLVSPEAKEYLLLFVLS